MEDSIRSPILIPAWIIDLESFRRWARSDDFPNSGQISFLDGEIWVDFNGTDFFSHGQVMGAIAASLGQLTTNREFGYLFTRRALWSNPKANFSTEPDVFFVSYHALTSGRARFIEDGHREPVELEGSPEMALEVVSGTSRQKDTVVLKRLYAKAGVDEYWLVDARGPESRFEIWRLQNGEYVAAANDGGWLSSAVFGRAFKLEPGKDRLGHPRFQLLVR
jgi:Uma2 family endonuclease